MSEWTLCVSLISCQSIGICAENKPDAGFLLRDMSISNTNSEKNQDIQNREMKNEEAYMQSDAFEVAKIIVNGNSVFSTEQLHELIKSLEGKALTLERLEQGIESITNYYRARGYPLARALIPEQVVEDGVVLVTVMEPVWGKVQVFNKSEVLDRVIERYTDILKPDQLVDQTELDRVSLMLSDIPGVDPHFILKPGELNGTTDLEVMTEALSPVTADWLLDNQGSKYTGRNRNSVNLQWNNPFRQGDLLGMNMLSTGELLNYKRISFEVPLALIGWQLGSAASELNYRLGDNLRSSMSSGSASQNSIWGKHQLQRSLDKNLAFTMQWDHMVLKDHQNGDAIKTDRSVNVWAFTLTGDSSDAWLGGGRNMWSSGLNLGQLTFDNSAAETTDENSAKHKGDFQRFNLAASRQQYISASTMLLVNADTQWAFKNLDSSQKFSLGGARSVRAYEPGTVSGDSGILFSVEWRQLLPQPSPQLNLRGQWLASLFVDMGMVKVNQQPWDKGNNEVSLSGIGIGLNWQGPDNWRASLSIAQPLENPPLAYAASKRNSAWFEIAKGFR
jgi:hemolysin activation/secretion protein